MPTVYYVVIFCLYPVLSNSSARNVNSEVPVYVLLKSETKIYRQKNGGEINEYSVY
jgi:hypothetical protein